MDTLFTYILKVAVFSSIFTAVYILLLRKETYFRLNRIYLVSSLLLSLMLPLIKFTVNGGEIGAQAATSVMLDPIIIKNNIVETINQTLFHWNIGSLFTIVFYSISLILLLKLTITFVVVVMKIFNSGYVKKDGYNHVIVNNNNEAFSFFNFVFTNSDQDSRIIRHEVAHAKQLHSLDLLLAEFFIILQWFNPTAWLLKKYLQETHEYLADEAVMEQNCDATEYQMLLLNRVFRVQPGITNQFNYSLLKRRFIMIRKKRSHNLNKLKVLGILPVAVLAFIVLSSQLVQSSTKKPETTKNLNNIIQKQKTVEKDKVYTVVEEIPAYTGGQNAMSDFIISTVKYPENAKTKGIQGKVYVGFVIEKDGSVSDVKVTKGVNKELDAEAVRVISLMPNWISGKEKGVKQRVAMTLPIQFKLK